MRTTTTEMLAIKQKVNRKQCIHKKVSEKANEHNTNNIYHKYIKCMLLVSISTHSRIILSWCLWTFCECTVTITILQRVHNSSRYFSQLFCTKQNPGKQCRSQESRMSPRCWKWLLSRFTEAQCEWRKRTFLFLPKTSKRIIPQCNQEMAEWHCFGLVSSGGW